MDHLDANLLGRQMDLEQEMLRASAEKLRAEIMKAKQRGAEDETPYASRLMINQIARVADGVRAVLAEAEAGRALNRAVAVKFLRMLEAEVCAAIALKGVLAGITKRRTLQRCAIIIGRMVEDELAWRKFEAEAPEKAEVTERKIAKAASYKHRRRVASVMQTRAGVERGEWTEAERLHVGVKLIEVVKETTGMLEFTRASAGASTEEMIYVTATPEALDWIERYVKWHAAVSPEWWPMIHPPKPWSGPWSGGYYSRMPRPLPLVKRSKREYLSELANVEMPEVYAAINAVQETAYRIDTWVLDVLERLWSSGHQVAGLPSREPLPLPPKPLDIDTNEEARKEWRKRAALVYDKNVRLLSKRVQLDQGMKMARRFADEAAIYFPHQMDFRGRLYAVPLLSYQGPDWMKGVLRFAEGKPIEDAEAAGWLMIQGANLWGENKGTLDERMAWVEAHEERIFLAGRDPFADFWWTNADGGDAAWQFLQWCREWTLFREHGYGFVSSFICAADGTCNGLQHFAAMLRDPIGGAAVNLLPGEKPADIYARVAEVVMGKLRLIAAKGTAARVQPFADAEWAERWLVFGVTRKVTKRCVMVLPYGGTQFSSREFIEEAISDRLDNERIESPFACAVKRGETMTETDGVFHASLFLAPIVWEAIGEVVVAARAAMGWLRKAAALVAQEGLPVNWRTPDGFPVQQAYYDSKATRVRVKLAGIDIKLVVREELPTVSRRLQEQGVSPNFVHSCDGAALRQYVVIALENGIRSFAMVHDSYGCVAADYARMQACLRHAFVEMYQEHNVMEELRDNIIPILSDERRSKMPPLPPMGTLDLEAVKTSDFFFA